MKRLKTIGIALLLALPLASRAYSQNIQLPAPESIDSAFVQLVQTRRSMRQFSSQAMDPSTLSTLLHTASQAWAESFSGQMIVRFEGKLYHYEDEHNQLIPWAGKLPDLRMYDSPCVLWLLPHETFETDDLWRWRGAVGQGIYLSAQAQRLGTVTVGGIGFPVGVPSEESIFTPSPVKNGITELLRHFPECSLSDLLEGNPADPITVKPDSYAKLLLWSAYGTSGYQDASGRAHRTIPSARNKYPMQLKLFTSGGVYSFDPQNNSAAFIQGKDRRKLFTKRQSKADAVLAVLWNREIMDHRGYALYETGAMQVNLWCTAKLLGLGMRSITAPQNKKIMKVLQIHNKPLEPIAVFLFNEGENRALPYDKEDGVYVGKSGGWPAMTVQVGLANGFIQSLKLLKSDGTSVYDSLMLTNLPSRMIFKGRTEVDGVTGATLSSQSLVKAVKAAIEDPGE